MDIATRTRQCHGSPRRGRRCPRGYFWRSSPEGHRNNRSESDVGGRPIWYAAEAVITGADDSSNAGDESSGGSRKIVNPHTWPVCAKIADIRGGQGESTGNGVFGQGHQPTQATAGSQCGGGEQAASPDEAYGVIVYRGEGARIAAVVLRRAGCGSRERESAKPSALSLRYSSV